MKVEMAINGSISFALVPENEMEEKIIKEFLKQENVITEITQATQILNKPVKMGSLLITKNTSGTFIKPNHGNTGEKEAV